MLDSRPSDDEHRLLLYIAENDPCPGNGVPGRLQPLLSSLERRGWIVWGSGGWKLNDSSEAPGRALEAALGLQVRRALETDD